MLKFFKSFFSKRKENSIIISDNNKHRVHRVGPYFALENIKIEDIINILNIENSQITTCEEAFEYLYENSNEKNDGFKIIISENIYNWIFIYWESGWFEYCRKVVEKLMAISNNRINYYYADSCVDGYDWIIVNNGEIIRELEYQMSDIENNKGEYLSDIEKNFILNIENYSNDFVFGEDVYTSVVEATCDLKTRFFEKDHKFIIGKIHIT